MQIIVQNVLKKAHVAVRFEDDDMVESVIMAPASLRSGAHSTEMVFRRSKHTDVITLSVNVADANNPDDIWSGLEGAFHE